MVFKKGQKAPWMIERNKRPDIRLQMSISHKGKPTWNKGLTKESHPSIAKTGFQKGHPIYAGCNKSWFNSDRVSGEKNVNWKGGITPINQKLRASIEYKLWRSKVFERDLYTCRNCGKSGIYLEAHHTKEFSKYPQFRFVVKYGLTLCKDCHNKIRGRNA